jgi:hypothetical protein
MATTTQPPHIKQMGMRRIWRTPNSKGRLFWLLFAVISCSFWYTLYLILFGTQPFTGPFKDPFRTGIMSFILIVVVAAYSLRRRFMHNLPGKVQNWLWMHMWLGIAALFLGLLHENYRYILHDSCFALGCLSRKFWGTASLYALLFIVVSGVLGRLLDIWQTRVIARDASTNTVGISQALRERVLELEYVVERLSAGKSDAFKKYCLLAMNSSATLPGPTPMLAQAERGDIQRAYETLLTRASLVQSIQRQNRAVRIVRTWRVIHISLVPIAFLIIAYHGVMELLTSVLHIISVSSIPNLYEGWLAWL